MPPQIVCLSGVYESVKAPNLNPVPFTAVRDFIFVRFICAGIALRFVVCPCFRFEYSGPMKHRTKTEGECGVWVERT